MAWRQSALPLPQLNDPSVDDLFELDQATRIEALHLSVRAYNCLRRADITTIEQIVGLSDNELLAIRNLGAKILFEIREKLTEYLESNPLPEWPGDPHSEVRSAYGPTLTISSQFSDQRAPIEALGLSRRSYNRLQIAGVDTIERLAAMSDADLLDIPSLGFTALAEIREKLAGYEARHSLSKPPESIEVLGLSSRTSNLLSRNGIHTVVELAQLSSEQIRNLRNAGEKTVEEVAEKLNAYLTEHPLLPSKDSERDKPEPDVSLDVRQPLNEHEPTRSLFDMASPGRITEIHLDRIPLTRLALPSHLQNQMLKHGIMSVGALARKPANSLSPDSLIRRQLTSYLAWLDEQDEQVHAAEVEERGLNPLHRSRLKEVSLDKLLDGWFLCVNKRREEVIRLRYGLDSEILTLEEAGQRLGLTRERVRQMQFHTLGILKRPSNWKCVTELADALVCLLREAGGVVDSQELDATLRHYMVIEQINPVGVARLISDVDDRVVWVRDCEAWVLAKYQRFVVKVQQQLSYLLTQHLSSLPIEELVTRFKGTLLYQNHWDQLDDAFIRACLRTHTAIEVDEGSLCNLAKWSGRRLDEIVSVLREIGEPTHYSIITERTNALLSPDQHASAHNIHAQMQRLPDIFVRVGHGVYGLAEWDLHNDGNLANAAYRILRSAGHPLHLDVITDKVLETWHVQRTSVYVALENDPRLSRIGRGVYYLREQITQGMEIPAQADFGDLYGERLAAWQAELDDWQKSSEFDTHNEVDRIRKAGLDFFVD